MRLPERWLADAGVLRTMARGMPAIGSHAQKLDAFYGPQAAHYDRFRERLLCGRGELIAGIDLPPAATVVDLGGGTGRNIEFFGERSARIGSYHVVDLCEPLLERARERVRAWPPLHVVRADAAQWQPPEPADVVVLSYALTMMPMWRQVIDNACAMLRAGGTLAVVDFHVADASPQPGRARHGWFTRRFWPAWFGHDGVRLDAAPLAALCATLPDHQLVETRAAVPYLPLLRVPYYRFLGRKR